MIGGRLASTIVHAGSSYALFDFDAASVARAGHAVHGRHRSCQAARLLPGIRARGVAAAAGV
jgi:hypothetical protein